MIASLRGKIIHRGINRLIMDVGGVGYELAVSLSTLGSLPADGETFLHVHTALRENALELYGFADPAEKTLFEMLLTVTGIGPRTSLIILSGVSPDGFREAVIKGDLHKLTSIPGIGKKSAERIVVELKEKIRKLGMPGLGAAGRPAASSLEDDLVSSLVNLGYKDRVAAMAAGKVLKGNGNDMDLAQAVRLALKELVK